MWFVLLYFKLSSLSPFLFRLVSTLTLLSKKLNCYKITLECAPKNVAFYQKFGYTASDETYMQCRFFDWGQRRLYTSFLGTATTPLYVHWHQNLTSTKCLNNWKEQPKDELWLCHSWVVPERSAWFQHTWVNINCMWKLSAQSDIFCPFGNHGYLTRVEPCHHLSPPYEDCQLL